MNSAARDRLISSSGIARFAQEPPEQGLGVLAGVAKVPGDVAAIAEPVRQVPGEELGPGARLDVRGSARRRLRVQTCRPLL